MVSISHCLPGSFVDVVFDCDVQFILFIFSVDPESGIPFKLFTEDLQNHTFCLLGGFIVDVGLYCNVNDCVVPLFLRTPLMLAVLGGHTDCVHLLLEKGAWPDAKDKGGSTALHRGVSHTTELSSTGLVTHPLHLLCPVKKLMLYSVAGSVM